MNNLRCPQCGVSHIKRNGYTYYGKQNYRCKDCDRQFVEDSQRIGEEMKDLIKVLLLERLFRKFIVPTQLSIRMAWPPIRPCYLQRGIKYAPRVQAILT